MKKYLFLPILALGVLVASCKKNTSPTLEEVTTTIVGSWTGDYSADGVQLAFDNSYGSPEQTLIFNADGTYDMVRDGRTIVEAGTYRVSTETIILVEKDDTYLIEAISDKKLWLEIDGNSYKYKKD
jgi:hypothetical protein